MQKERGLHLRRAPSTHENDERNWLSWGPTSFASLKHGLFCARKSVYPELTTKVGFERTSCCRRFPDPDLMGSSPKPLTHLNPKDPDPLHGYNTRLPLCYQQILGILLAGGV